MEVDSRTELVIATDIAERLGISPQRVNVLARPWPTRLGTNVPYSSHATGAARRRRPRRRPRVARRPAHGRAERHTAAVRVRRCGAVAEDARSEEFVTGTYSAGPDERHGGGRPA